MIHVLVRHKVADFNRWKEAFDSHLNARKHAGEPAFRLFQGVDDPRDVTLLLDWDSDRACAPVHELRRTAQAECSRPEWWARPTSSYVEDVRTVHRTAAD